MEIDISSNTAQKKHKIFPIKDFFCKGDQIRNFLWIWSYLLKKSLMEKLYFLCSVRNCTWEISSKKIHVTTFIIASTELVYERISLM